ncbi:hypothetical protein BGZ67_010188 [Mortierella alpina]|nr:hypothetical protein BGZ67_010188 [Mortierella alpina]
MSQYQASITEEPVTVERKPFKPGQGQLLRDPGTARANIAATVDRPGGTTKNNWAARHTGQTVLQQHCAFFDSDGDGIIWPRDTFCSFYALGFNVLLSCLAAVVIHSSLSYPTCPSWIPDPFFRIWIHRIHKAKHGSDTGMFDTEGRFVPQHFEDVFSKYAPEGQDGLTLGDVWRMLKGQRVIADPVGWFGAFFEWMATYILLWPADGVMQKEDIRRIYDGSLFYEVAARLKIKKDQ